MSGSVQEAKRRLEAAMGPSVEAPAVVAEAVLDVEVAPAREIRLTVPAGARYSVEDLQLLLEVFAMDVRLPPADMILLAQARQVMSTREDGRIPFVMRKGVLAVRHRVCGGRA